MGIIPPKPTAPEGLVDPKPPTPPPTVGPVAAKPPPDLSDTTGITLTKPDEPEPIPGDGKGPVAPKPPPDLTSPIVDAKIIYPPAVGGITGAIAGGIKKIKPMPDHQPPTAKLLPGEPAPNIVKPGTTIVMAGSGAVLGMIAGGVKKVKPMPDHQPPTPIRADDPLAGTVYNADSARSLKVDIHTSREDQKKLAEATKRLTPYEIEPGAYDIQGYLWDNAKTPALAIKTLYDAGFDKATIKEAAMANVEASGKAVKEAAKPYYSKMWQAMTPWDESAGETANIAGIGIMAAEIIVPGVYTIRHWDEMSVGEKGLSIALDAVCLIPVFGAAARGAKTVTVSGRAARVAGGVKGLGREAVSYLRAPADMIIHPIASAKSAVRNTADFIENIVHPGKLPEAILTTGEHTVKLRVTETTTAKQAKAIRDQLMELSLKGERPIVKIGGQTVELAQSPLMKELKGGLAHATPNIDILERAIVKPKPGLGLKEQGLFLSHEAPTRFTGSTAFGVTQGVPGKPGILIISPKSAAKTISSGKIYNSPKGPVVEMERVLPLGTKIPTVKQRLFTRIGPGKQQIEVWLENPLSLTQRAKLKGLALIEEIKAPFNPAITVKGTGGIGLVSETDMNQLISAVNKAGNVDQARALARVAASERIAPRTIESIMRGRRIPDKSITGNRLGSIKERQKAIQEIQREIKKRAEADRVEARREADRPESKRAEAKRRETERIEADRVEARREAERKPPERKPSRRKPPDREPPRREVTRKPPRRVPPDREPPRRVPPDREPPGREPPGREPPGREPPGREPPGREPPGREPPGREPPGREPPGRIPPPKPPGRIVPPPRVVPPRPTPPRIVPPKKTPRVIPPGLGGPAGKERRFPKGTVAWKQGIGWWVFMPPYGRPEDRTFVLKKPKGAVITSDAKTAAGTIQSVGGPSPVDLKFDMGVVDVSLRNPPGKPTRSKGRKAIKFKRDRDKTHSGVKVNKQTGSKKVGPYYTKGGAVSRKPMA